MNINIVILELHFFQIFSNFWEETRRLITVFEKPYKKKVVPSAILIVEEEYELYAEIYHSYKSIADINHTLLQTPKEKLAKIFLLKKNHFTWKLFFGGQKKKQDILY